MQLPKVAHTELYGLEPYRPRTMHVESLRSYVGRLAMAHSVSPRQLIGRVLCKFLSLTVLNCLGGVSKQGRALGPTKAAQRVSALLVNLTGREELRWTTLSPLIAHLNGQHICSNIDRICKNCFAEDLKEGRSTYERLIWSVALVNCCPIHGSILELRTCGRPTAYASRRRYLRVPGVCQDCGAVAYSCSTSIPIVASKLELERARQIGRLIEALPVIEASSASDMKKRYHSALRRDRSSSRLAIAAKLTDASLSSWLRTSRRFSLAKWLSLAEATQTDLAELMLGYVDLKIKSVAVTQANKRSLFPVERTAEIRKSLLQSAQEGKSFLSTCRDLGVPWGSVFQRFPKERQMVTSAYEARRKAIYLVALQDAMLMACQLMRDGADLQLKNLQTDNVAWAWGERRTLVFMELRTALGYPDRDFAIRNKFRYIEQELADAKRMLREAATQPGEVITSYR